MTYRLDLSIRQLDDVLSTKKVLDPVKVNKFLKTEISLSEKIDGLKINVWRNTNPYTSDPSENWVVSYKNQVLYPEEFDQTQTDQGYDQFSVVWQTIVRLHEEMRNLPASSHIPPETELFFEFVATKHTLMRKYQQASRLFIIGFAPSKGEVVGGYLQTYPQEMQTDISRFGSLLVPYIVPNLFKGVPYKTDIDPITQYMEFKQSILAVPSILGGAIEGAVGQYNGEYFKFQQIDQVDATARKQLRALSTEDDPKDELKYWATIDKIANQFVSETNTTRIQDLRADFFTFVENQTIPTHSKKSETLVVDDIYIRAKKIFLHNLPENQNGLVVGRFQTLTTAHQHIIETAAQHHHILWVAVVNGSITKTNKILNPLTFFQRKQLIEALGLSNVRVIEVPTGNVRAIINKIPSGITKLYCGSDRKASYKEVTQGTLIEVIEIPRTDKVSGTELRNAIRNDDRTLFEALSASPLHVYWQRLKEWIQ